MRAGSSHRRTVVPRPDAPGWCDGRPSGCQERGEGEERLRRPEAPRHRPASCRGASPTSRSIPGPEHLVRGGRLRRGLEDDQRGHDLDADLRQGGLLLDRLRDDRPEQPQVDLGGHRGERGRRHVGYGDGVYRSRDAGASWENLGLKGSEHISKIVVAPGEARTSSGWPRRDRCGRREATAGSSRRRTAARPGQGCWGPASGRESRRWRSTRATPTCSTRRPGSAIARWPATWAADRSRASTGRPTAANLEEAQGGAARGPLGKIGLAMSPPEPRRPLRRDRAQPARGRRATARPTAARPGRSDRTTVSGATGPHYYQELYASPHAEGRIYLVDVRMQVSDDGGQDLPAHGGEGQALRQPRRSRSARTTPTTCWWAPTAASTRASTWRRPGASWRTCRSRSSTRSRWTTASRSTTSTAGPRTTAPRAGPRAPTASTASPTPTGSSPSSATAPAGHRARQPEHHVLRVAARGTWCGWTARPGERVYIQPQPEPGDPPQRFNWDAPILVSPHSPKRIYYASQRVWRSDDRGDSWKPVSGDLTREQDRMKLPLMGRAWSWTRPGT